MDVNKLGPGQRIAAGAAVLLFIDLFLAWYSAGAFGVSVNGSAWEVFSWTDLLLTLTVIVAIAMAAQAMGLLSIPLKLSTVLLPLAAVMTLIVLYRLFNQPGPNEVISNEFGSYIGFVLTALITYGAFRAQGEHEDVSAPGSYRVGDRSATTGDKSATTAPPASTPPASPPPASTTDDAPPPPPPPATP